jgi:signal transduction histidine kinase/CheY-like chemotaxis protein
MHENDVPRYREHIKRLAALADGEIAGITYRMRHADGSWRWFHGNDSVFERDADGRARLLIGTATDITAIKDAEVALRENSHRLDFILSAANMGVWELNLDLGTILCTDSLARLLKLNREDTPKTLEDFLSLINPDDREDERQRISGVAANGSLYHSEFRITRSRGEVRWMASVAKLVRDESGKPLRLLGLMRDITQRKHAESDRKRMEQRIRQSEKMEALGALAGGIAHDFNNILTAINGNARLTLHELPADHPVRINIEEIHRGAMRATDLVSRILAFSRNEEPALRQVDLGSVVDEAARLLRATMPAMIEIRFESSRTSPVLADATQIHQVIMNLGANARDAMSARGGILAITLCELPIDSRLLARAPELSGESCVCLTVEDTGPGIPHQDLDRIFEPFFTTKAQGHGTGMGLAMVHGIVRRHGGVILASSPPGGGARFDIFFPTAVQRTEASQVANEPQIVHGRGERILYVDDEEPLVFLATRMLKRMGFQVEGFTDPRQALHEFERDPQRWDMVITDLGMPGMSGLDLAAELLRIRPGLPLMLTSGYVRIEDAERARMIGAEDIVLKPNTIEEMGPLILGRLEASRGMS